MTIAFLLVLILCLGCGMGISGDNHGVKTVHLANCIDVESDGLMGIGSICYLDNGDLVVLDHIGREIHVYRGSEHVFQTASVGEGPLEYNSPGEVVPRPGGGFAVNCPGDGKVLLYNSEYQCEGEIIFHGHYLRPGTPVRLKILSDDYLIGIDYIFDEFTGCGTRLSGWDVSDPGNPIRLQTYRTRLAETVHPLRYITQTAIAFDINSSTGELHIADISPETYEISTVSVTNQNMNTFTHSSEPAEKTTEELGLEVQRLRNAWVRGTGSEAGFDYEPDLYHNLIQALYCGEDGELWVRRGSPQTVRFDVFSPTRELSAEFSFVTESTQETDGWLVAIGAGSIAVAPLNPGEEYLLFHSELPDPASR